MKYFVSSDIKNKLIHLYVPVIFQQLRELSNVALILNYSLCKGWVSSNYIKKSITVQTFNIKSSVKPVFSVTFVYNYHDFDLKIWLLKKNDSEFLEESSNSF